jgi:hypothetical protein
MGLSSVVDKNIPVLAKIFTIRGRMAMKLKNLDMNILYYVCEKLTRRDRCGGFDTGLIYEKFSDIPDEEIEKNIQALVDRGWLRNDTKGSCVHLTKMGRSEIRSFIPDQLLRTCQKPINCWVD